MQTAKLLSAGKATPRPRWPKGCIAATALIGVGWMLFVGTGMLRGPKSRHTGNCPGSAAAYELSHDFFGGGGGSFFDEAQWQYFTLPDPTGGPTSYLSHTDALESGLLEEGDGWAVLRGGTRDASDASNPLRRSVRIHSRDAWDGREQGFLLEVGYTHVPHGCGVWPALWMYCDGSELADAADGRRCGPWPQNGEIDLLEFANEFFSKTSLHFGADAQCRLNATAVEECGPFFDKNGIGFDCATEYFPAATDSLSPAPWAGPRYGCAPNRFDAWPTPKEINAAPGTFVFEWSSEAMKVWNFPRSAVPADLTAGSPEPSTWDVGRMWSYYPLQGCPTVREQLRPLNLVINIAYCGDWAGGDWERQFDDGWVGRGFLFNWMQQLLGESCASKWGDFGGERSGGFSKLTQSGARQACNAFINARESDAGVAEEAYFNFTRLRVYTARGAARR